MSQHNPSRLSAVLLAGAALALPAIALAAPKAEHALAFKAPPPPPIATPISIPIAEPSAKPVWLPTAQRPVVHPVKRKRKAARPSAPAQRVLRANAAARVQPSKSGYANAVQSYAYAPGELYQLYAAPGHITDIMLEEGEQLTGTGPVTIDLPGPVHRDLTAYAEAVGKESGQPVEPAKLIAPMLARFMATDRAFVRGRGKG